MNARYGIYGAVLLLACLALAFCTDQIYPWMRFAGPLLFLAAAAGLAVGAASLLLHRVRPDAAAIAATSLAFATVALGLECWGLGFTLAYELGGRGAAFLGTALFGFGVVPVSLVAAAQKGYFLSIGALGLSTVFFAGSGALWMRAKKPRAFGG